MQSDQPITQWPHTTPSSMILSDTEGATPFSRCLFLNYHGYQLIASFLLHFQIIPVLMTSLPKKSPCGCFRKVRPPCLTHRVIHKQDPCVSGSSASLGRKQPELQQQLGIIRPTEIASETPLVSDWGEERLSIRLKQIKRATGKGRREGGKVKPKLCITPEFPLHSPRDTPKQNKGTSDCSLTWAPPILGWKV